jgi:8-oxo-dGTP pyrophosphatase MutT (NUDIX family)
MYEVYILNRPVIFTENTEAKQNDLVFHEPSKKQLQELPNLLRHDTAIKTVILESKNVQMLWMNFCILYKEVLAAGCVVENQDGAFLWIERNTRWDLPKGKVEPSESIEEAATREVTEETGIDRLSLRSHLRTTYHTYEEDGIPILKTTFWFHAFHDGSNTTGIPQSAEGITDVQWKFRPFGDELLENTYPSILDLVSSIPD